jgi:hypothetical protein
VKVSADWQAVILAYIRMTEASANPAGTNALVWGFRNAVLRGLAAIVKNDAVMARNHFAKHLEMCSLSHFAICALVLGVGARGITYSEKSREWKLRLAKPSDFDPLVGKVSCFLTIQVASL